MIMRNYSFYGILFLCVSLFNVNLTAEVNNLDAKVKNFNIPTPILNAFSNAKIEKIVIDAGHGGHDGGTSGLQTVEKNITLNIALMLGEAIQARFPDLKIIYTRKTDIFVPLSERARIANDAHADLFISIHCNAMPAGVVGRKIHGSETYVLGATKKERNLVIAKRENEAIFLERNHADYNFSDSDSPEWHIFMSMYQQNYLERSIQFAEKVEQKMHAYSKRKSRGVLQNNFHVLREVAMPSVLIETGYLTNSSDEKYLKSKAGQAQIVQAISDAFYEYKTGIEANNDFLAQAEPAPRQNDLILAENTTEIPRPVIKRSQRAIETAYSPPQPPVAQKKQAPKHRRDERPTRQRPKPKRSLLRPKDQSPKTNDQTYHSIKPVTQVSGPKIISVSEGARAPQPETKRVPTPTPTVSRPVYTRPKKKIVDLNKLSVTPVFKIQIAASKKPLNLKTQKYAELSNVEVVYENGYFKYLTGHTKHWSDITSIFKVLKKKGFNGFIVAYLNDQRIGLQEARDLIQ